jgi:hypothetical protein
VDDELAMKSTEAIVAYCKLLYDVRLKGLRKTTSICQGSRCPGCPFLQVGPRGIEEEKKEDRKDVGNSLAVEQ